MANIWGESAEERVSFDDSDQFDEDSMSLCSWVSENDIVGALTWRGWKKSGIESSSSRIIDLQSSDDVLSLVELSAKVVAKYHPFESVEEQKPPIPDQIQLKVAFWSFPQNEDDIQLYCCLSHGSLEEFQKAELIIKHNKVQEVYQIGFHLSATVLHNNRSSKQEQFSVAVTFDRCQIVSSNCSCNPNATWCAHITALCLFRIRFPDSVCFRVPVSESLSRLERNQLQKFAQYLLNELPPQVLPTAQKLLDDLLTSPSSAINSCHGAPDPTAGACLMDEPAWCLDETSLHDHIRKILCKFCGPSPVAFVDLNSVFLASSAPLPSLEWSNFLRPLSSRDPEGIWNLLDIVRDLFRRRDKNSLKILEILTEECLNFHQLTLWWFVNETEDGKEAVPAIHKMVHCNQTKNQRNQSCSNSNLASTEFAKHTGARLLSEIVSLWKVAVMNPFLSEADRKSLKVNLENWQKIAIDKARRGFSGGEHEFNSALSRFNCFVPAIIASEKNWKSFYYNLGINYDVSHSSLDKQKPNCTRRRSPINLPKNVDFDDLFSCMESLYCLGFSTSVKGLAVYLAEQLLSTYSIREIANQKSIQSDSSCVVTKNERNQSNSINDNCDLRISEALKVAFICKILNEDNEHQYLAFKIAILALGLPRYPADSKSLEVRLAHCEMTLRSALKLVAISSREVELIRQYARFLLNADSVEKNMIIPFILAIYVFEVLCDAPIQSNILTKQRVKFENGFELSKEDCDLGYQAAVITLGRTSCISGVKYSMACESMRRLRNDLALSIICQYKDDNEKIKSVLSLLLSINRYENNNDGDTCTAEEMKNKICNKKTKKNMKQSMKYVDKAKGTNFCKSSWQSESQWKEDNNKAVLHSKSTNVDIYQEDKPNTCIITTTTEDWDEEVKEISDKQMHDVLKEDNLLTGTVTGVLQFDVNIADTEVSHTHCYSTYDEASTTSNDEDQQCLQTNFEKITLESCDPSIFPEKYGQVVVSGLSSEQLDNRQSAYNSSSSQSFDSTNQWDPALSWADAVDEKIKSITAHRISYESDVSDDKKDTSNNINSKQNNTNVSFDCTRIESDSYALFELAKNVLSKASHQTEQNAFVSENEQNVNNRIHHGLRLAAFEIGLFSLNLQNHVSPKWMSRTYSSYVSWIVIQAVDIGSTALRLLNDKWQGVLTPSEVIDISNRASRLGETMLRRTAAELAVSCLPKAYTLNPGEIQQALSLCKDIDTELLVRACNAIECASKSGGIQPEMLFLVARQWHFIHEKSLEKSNGDMQTSKKTTAYADQRSKSVFQCQNKSAHKQTLSNQSNNKENMVLQHQHFQQHEKVAGNTHGSVSRASSVTILTPEQYVQQQMHQMAQEMLSRNLSQQVQSLPHSDEMTSFSWIYPQYLGSLHHCPMPQHILLGKTISKHDAVSMPIVNFVSDDEEADNIPQQLQNAYRVGMKALEALANRGSDERACVKYSPSPPCSDDIRWLCALAASLGPHNLQRFCFAVIGAVSSPYLLHDVALEAARHFALYNPAQLASHLRSPCVSPIVVKCLAMYTELVRHNLVLLSQGGYADFVDLLRRARSAFCMAPGGMTKFNELLEMIRKKYPKKRDLWQLIMNGLSRA